VCVRRDDLEHEQGEDDQEYGGIPKARLDVRLCEQNRTIVRAAASASITRFGR
jgi:hypothetical protein